MSVNVAVPRHSTGVQPVRLLLSVLVLFIAACGGGGSSPRPVAIVSQPVSIERAESDIATFSVVASGSGVLTYQWIKDGMAIDGANGATLELAAVQAEDAGFYRVEVSNARGNVISDVAELTVVRQRATGIWYGLIDNDAIAHMIVPPSGDMLMLQFDSASNPLQGLYLGQVLTREGTPSGKLRVPAGSQNRVQFFGAGHAHGNYFLQIPENSSAFVPREGMAVDLRFYENVDDLSPIASPRPRYVAGYQAAISDRNTPLDSLAATWWYLDDDPSLSVSITLNASGEITGDSYYGLSCALSGQLLPVEDSTALFHATLLHANRDGVCPVADRQYQGYVYLAPLPAGDRLLWYLYLKDADNIVAFYYLPLQQ